MQKIVKMIRISKIDIKSPSTIVTLHKFGSEDWKIIKPNASGNDKSIEIVKFDSHGLLPEKLYTKLCTKLYKILFTPGTRALKGLSEFARKNRKMKATLKNIYESSSRSKSSRSSSKKLKNRLQKLDKDVLDLISNYATEMK